MILYDLRNRTKNKWACTLLLLTVMVGMLTACGKERQSENEAAEEPQAVIEDFGEGQSITDGETAASISEESADAEESGSEEQRADEIKNRFGENCISEQTFEVELSEYDGKVWFVPYAPVEEGQTLNVQIVQDGEILTQLHPYVPESLEGQSFTSLDAVSFYDVNYDDNTDIVLIETYGNTSFAAVYYGFDADADYAGMFFSEDTLSEMITEQVNPLTIGEVRSWLNEKKNGEFENYQEAYTAVLKLYELSYTADLTGDLIYINDDDIPELAVGYTGYWVGMYTYHDGKVYRLMDDWAYGAMGNAGYEYIPKGNRLRNYNNDYAGLILYTTYMTISNQYTLEIVTQIVTYNFDDVNENGMPDEDEMDSVGYYGANYVDGELITYEQCVAYDVGEYERIIGTVSLEELIAGLEE